MKQPKAEAKIGTLEQLAKDVRLIAQPIARQVINRIGREMPDNEPLQQQVLDQVIEILGMQWLGGVKKVAPEVNGKRQKPMRNGNQKADAKIAAANRAVVEKQKPEPPKKLDRAARAELAHWFDWEQMAEHRVKPVHGYLENRVHPRRRKRGEWRKDMRKAMKGN